SHYHFSYFNPPPPSETYPLSLHDALPILDDRDVDDLAHDRHELHEGRDDPAHDGHADGAHDLAQHLDGALLRDREALRLADVERSEEHTSELQSPYDLVCRLLLEKKKTTT